MKHLKVVLFVTISFIAGKASAQRESFIPSLNKPNPWVDSVFQKMSRRKKIAQLFFVRANTNKGIAYEDSVAKIIGGWYFSRVALCGRPTSSTGTSN